MLPRTLVLGGTLERLAEALHDAGFGRASGVKSGKELNRLENHLSDLRKILFRFDFVDLQRGTPLEEGEEEDASL